MCKMDSKWIDVFDAAGIKDPDKLEYVNQLLTQNIEVDELLQFDYDCIESTL